jgi:hypothetical protein
VIDRRAYATYVNSGASAMLTLVVDAESLAHLLDRSKLLDNVAKAWHGYRHPSDPCNCNPTLRHDNHVHISVLR